jgi:hypothetical protein
MSLVFSGLDMGQFYPPAALPPNPGPLGCRAHGRPLPGGPERGRWRAQALPPDAKEPLRMRQLRYSVAASLDGYIAGPHGEFNWIVADPEID